MSVGMRVVSFQSTTARLGKVLIHAGAGDVGQAAIMVAQHLGAEVYVTVGSPAERSMH
jgi:NADPH:quinone reductase-like Zn-dependent oxidoreductase